jgi:hypothetical protein
MVLGEVESEIERDYDEGGDEDADDEHPCQIYVMMTKKDLRTNPSTPKAEEGIFELDDECAVEEGELYDA